VHNAAGSRDFATASSLSGTSARESRLPKKTLRIAGKTLIFQIPAGSFPNFLTTLPKPITLTLWMGGGAYSVAALGTHRWGLTRNLLHN
jgi:hypothetical protein